MPEEVLAKAFDPFFTTKPAGQGTGLGLSQVYGFVTQSAGHIRLKSEVGRGTTLRIHLPRVQADAPSLAKSETGVCGPAGAELILVVDDEPAVLEFSSTALAELGYRVLSAGDPAAALDLLRQHRDINLLFTDVVMPGVSGPQLATSARALHPQLKVLFTSGYTRDELGHNSLQSPGVHLLNKPYSLDVLARQVREVLDEPVTATTLTSRSALDGGTAKRPAAGGE
jgi:CheY-like chemotaxis protein